MRKVQINTKQLSASKIKRRPRHVFKYEPFVNLQMDTEALEFTDYKKAKLMYNVCYQYIEREKKRGKIFDYKAALRSRGKLIYLFKKSTRKPFVYLKEA